MHRQTRTTVRLVACAALVLLAACPPPPKEACDRPARQTLVFYDQSASSAADSATKELFRETLRDALKSGLECRGDVIHGFLVHANTRGKAGRVRAENTMEPLGDTLAMPGMVRARKVAEHRRGMEAMRKEGEAELEKLVTARVNGTLASHTDLIGTLQVIDDELGKLGPADTLPVRVIYLGDMHESTAGRGRDFDQHPPSSMEQAEAWADADTVMLNQMHIDQARMSRVHVRVLLGNLANKGSAGPEIRRYWERLFEHAGIRHVEFG